jgi:thymidylate synthase (FAD)
MLIIPQEVRVPASQLDEGVMLRLERCARICYKSEDKMDDEYNTAFLQRIVASGHESVIEHEKVTALFIIDRGISHELVRHRIGSYSQESTRYCNYSKDKFGREISVIEPFFYSPGSLKYRLWEESCLVAEKNYLELLDQGSTPQEARSILPTCLKTEIAVTFNLREWRHFFYMRCSAAAHPQMRQVAIPLLLLFRERFQVLFDSVPYDTSFPLEHFASVYISDDLFNL